LFRLHQQLNILLLLVAGVPVNMSALAGALAGCALAPHQFLPQRHTQSPSAQEAQLNHRQPQATTAQLRPHSASIPQAAAAAETSIPQVVLVALAAEEVPTQVEHSQTPALVMQVVIPP
jgi:hypothetical protein